MKNKQGIGNDARKAWGVLSKAAIYALLIVVSYLFLEPIVTIISKTFMNAQDIVDPAVQWLPRSVSLTNLEVASKVLRLPHSLLNSIGFSSLLAFCQVVVSALTGYAFSRYQFRFKNFWFMMLLLAFILPLPVLMIPRLMMFTTAQEAMKISLIGTPIPQVLMAVLGQGTYSTVLILIFTNFFNMIPRVLDEAAMIDGANSAQVFFHVTVRLSISTILVVFLLSFVWNWNETYVTATLVRSSIELLPHKLNAFDSQFDSLVSAQGGGFRLNEAYKMAATLIAILPLVVLYIFVQKKFIQGIENAGITGE
ncbi:MAG: carbohydrate ABC transporter permease [Clostridiales bacterium]|jgi:multiple sugar transport system permease protein|nr:carbohydrate ABC transporter permease [Clostridiales bacterium]